MRRKPNNLLLLILIAFGFNSIAQPGPLTPETNPVLSSTHSKINLYGDSSYYKLLFGKMDNIFFNGRGKVNIIHIGGSHIQADMWSDQVRGHLQQVMPAVNGGRGFLFPYKMAKTNNPSGYEVQFTGEWTSCRNVKKDTNCVLGLSGISVTTRDSLSSLLITFKDNPRNYSFTKVKIYYPESGSFSIHFPSDSVIGRKRDLSGGYTEFTFPYRQDSLYVEFVKSDSLQRRFTLHGISFESDEPGIVYHSIGVNGASVPSYNRCQLLGEHIATLNPDLVIFSIGINDAHAPDFSPLKYERDYDTLIQTIRRVAPNVAILFTTNSDSYVNRKTPNRNAIEVKMVMEKLSEKYNGAVWDMFGVMGGLGSIRTWESKGLAQRDRIHLNRGGYQLLGDMLFNAILKSYGGYLGNN